MAELPPLIKALLDPKVYPETRGEIKLLQTHVSYLLLTGEYVYKIKKPVDFGFLDFTSLDKRRSYCEREVFLNSRLCSDMYLGVVPITREGDDFAIGGRGEAVEYAVKMRQLPQERMMDRLLAEGRVSPEMVRRVAQKLAQFHMEAETDPEISSYGHPQAIKKNTDENFAQTEKYVDISIPSRHYQAIKFYTDSLLDRHLARFHERIREGRIRDCHGDVHSAHVCFSDGIYIYDCIEFNERFRYSDVAAEVAFLAMDLDYHGHPELSRTFIEAYVQATGDRGLLRFLDFYKCYRAYVRGKVESFKLDDPHVPEGERAHARGVAAKYFALAFSYATHGPQPSLVITTGLVGTGKSTLAQELAQRMGAMVISSDLVRKRLANIPPTEHRFEDFDRGVYCPEFSQKTYNEMFEDAQRLLSVGQSVIIDASFRRAQDRERAMKLARGLGANFWVIECVLDEGVVKDRLERRLREEVTPSDGRWEIFERQKQEFDRVTEIPPENHLVVDTWGQVEEVVAEVMAKLAQFK